MSKQSRGERGELLVTSLLNKRKDYFKLLNNITFINKTSEMSHQIDHIFINKYGVFVLETKNYYGSVISDTNDSFWLRVINGKKEKISNPIKQNKSHAVIVNRLLDKKYDVIPAVVFVRDNAPYTGDENVINLSDLNLFIDSYPYKKLLSNKEIDEITNKIVKSSSSISSKEHVENISYLKQVKKEFVKEMEYAIETRRCPRCNSPILNSRNEYRCSKCDFKFKL